MIAEEKAAMERLAAMAAMALEHQARARGIENYQLTAAHTEAIRKHMLALAVPAGMFNTQGEAVAYLVWTAAGKVFDEPPYTCTNPFHTPGNLVSWGQPMQGGRG